MLVGTVSRVDYSLGPCLLAGIFTLATAEWTGRDLYFADSIMDEGWYRSSSYARADDAEGPELSSCATVCAGLALVMAACLDGVIPAVGSLTWEGAIMASRYSVSTSHSDLLVWYSSSVVTD